MPITILKCFLKQITGSVNTLATDVLYSANFLGAENPYGNLAVSGINRSHVLSSYISSFQITVLYFNVQLSFGFPFLN